eukprot:SAG31_NODE_100_length_25264_cov_38.715359_14_plen_76_part_00
MTAGFIQDPTEAHLRVVRVEGGLERTLISLGDGDVDELVRREINEAEDSGLASQESTWDQLMAATAEIGKCDRDH